MDSDYLLDFDILHVSHVSELLHYIQPEFLPPELGGTCHTHPDTWLPLQRQVRLCLLSDCIFTAVQVDCFTVGATKTARKLSAFMRLLNQDERRTDMEEVEAVWCALLYLLCCRRPTGTGRATSSCGPSWSCSLARGWVPSTVLC